MNNNWGLAPLILDQRPDLPVALLFPIIFLSKSEKERGNLCLPPNRDFGVTLPMECHFLYPATFQRPIVARDEGSHSDRFSQGELLMVRAVFQMHWAIVVLHKETNVVKGIPMPLLPVILN